MGRRKSSEKKDDYTNSLVYINIEKQSFNVHNKKGKLIQRLSNIKFRSTNPDDILNQIIEAIKDIDIQDIKKPPPPHFDFDQTKEESDSSDIFYDFYRDYG